MHRMGVTNEGRISDLEHKHKGEPEGIGIYSTMWIDPTDPDALESAGDAAVGDKRAPNFRTLKAGLAWIEREYPELEAQEINHIRGIVGHRTRPGVKFNIVDMMPKYSPKETAKQLQARIDAKAEHAEGVARSLAEIREERKLQ